MNKEGVQPEVGKFTGRFGVSVKHCDYDQGSSATHTNSAPSQVKARGWGKKVAQEHLDYHQQTLETQPCQPEVAIAKIHKHPTKPHRIVWAPIED